MIGSDSFISCSLTCRRRKLKCDEQKPRCGQCAKGSRDCVFCERVIFRDGQGQPLCPMGGDAPACAAFREGGQTWLEVPRRCMALTLPFLSVERERERGYDKLTLGQ